MKNICILNGNMSRGGGTERMTQILANLLVENPKYSVSVLSIENPTGQTFFHLDERVKVATLNQGNLIKKICDLHLFNKKNKIDVLINVDVMLAIYSLPVKFLNRNIKLVAWEMFNIRNNIGSKHTKIIRQLSLIFASYYVCLTKADMNTFKSEMKCRCPITYIYNPIDYNMDYDEYLTKSKKIITVGHFFYTKGFDLAVEVAKKVFDKHPDWIWEFYGDGIELAKIKEMVKKYNMTKNIIFAGRTNDILSAYMQGSLYVMTSRTEGFGLVLTEAKSCNLPTLAFDVEFGPAEIIEDGISGYLVKPFDCEEMAKKICYLIENPNIRKEFSRHAKDNLATFSKDRFRKDWEFVLNHL